MYFPFLTHVKLSNLFAFIRLIYKDLNSFCHGYVVLVLEYFYNTES